MLFISKDVAMTDVVSDETVNPGDAGYNPITTQHNITGTTVEVKVFLFNDNAAKKYTGITAKPVDTSSTDESAWIQLAPDNAGVAGAYSSNISLPDVNDSDVAHPIWVKVTTPVVADTQNKTDLVIEIDTTEFAV